MKITFIGGGNMGEAFIASLTQKNIYKPADITVIERNTERLDYLSKNYNVKTSTNINETQNAEIIFLAIKPQGINDLPTFDFSKKRSPICISILAGTTIQMIQTKFMNTKIVRTMPNLGQFVGKGVTGLYFDTLSSFTDNEKQSVKNIFITGGKIVEVNNEDKLDAVTAISGSGPAYCFYFLEAFAKVTHNLGFNKNEAEEITRQTLIGATEILKLNPEDSAETWRKKATSKGGTTEAALKVLQDSQFEQILAQAVETAQKRAEELGAQ